MIAQALTDAAKAYKMQVTRIVIEVGAGEFAVVFVDDRVLLPGVYRRLRVEFAGGETHAYLVEYSGSLAIRQIGVAHYEDTMSFEDVRAAVERCGLPWRIQAAYGS